MKIYILSFLSESVRSRDIHCVISLGIDTVHVQDRCRDALPIPDCEAAIRISSRKLLASLFLLYFQLLLLQHSSISSVLQLSHVLLRKNLPTLTSLATARAVVQQRNSCVNDLGSRAGVQVSAVHVSHSALPLLQALNVSLIIYIK